VTNRGDRTLTPSRHRLRTAVGLIALAAVALVAAMCLSVPAQAAPAADGGASTQIVGGGTIPITRYSYTVYLITAEGEQFCGGSLIRANKVLTAAHCVDGWELSWVRVVAGRSDTQSTNGHVADVTDIWISPSWDISTFTGDLAILTLDQNLPYRTIPLASNYDQDLYVAGTQARVLGWGKTCSGCQPSQHLRTAFVPVVDDDTCGAVYEPEFNPTAMVCAGPPHGGVGTCQGDSGGPLVAGGKLIGITSHNDGNGCALPGTPGVYTQVSVFRLQIQWQLDGQG